jgi:hypothetical protein
MEDGMAEEKKMVSIWTWVGLILGIYGVIIFATGIYFMKVTNEIAQRGHNPGLWWGALMIIAGVVFVTLFRQASKAK